MMGDLESSSWSSYEWLLTEAECSREVTEFVGHLEASLALLAALMFRLQ